MNSIQPTPNLQDEMFLLIEAYLNGGKPQKHFCSENNISFGKFTYWLIKYRKSHDYTGFIPLTLTGQNIHGDTRIELPGGVNIVFNRSGNSAFITDLISKAMERHAAD